MFYGSAADFQTYHSARGRTILPTWDDATIEAALLVSSEWVDNNYGEQFSGYKTDGYPQTRQWPRNQAITNTFPQYVFEDTEIPDEMADATYEAAFRELTTPGSLNVDFTPNKYLSASVEDAVEVKYAQNLTLETSQVQIRVISSILFPLLDPDKTASFSGLSGDISR